MLKANFKISETGGTGVVQLQALLNSTIGWANVGSPITLANGRKTVDDNTDIEIDTTVFDAGMTYQFRLTDVAGTPISNTVNYEIPAGSEGGNGGSGGNTLLYVSVKSSIGFVNDTGDNWTVTFSKTPADFNTYPATSLAGYQAAISFYQGCTRTMLMDDNHDVVTRTEDYMTTIGGHGAGVYEVICIYLTQDGRSTGIERLIKVDDSGNILVDAMAEGYTLNYALDTSISVNAVAHQNNQLCPVNWTCESSDGVVQNIGTGAVQTFTPATGNKLLIYEPVVDSTIADDYNGKFRAYIQVSPAI